jgi:hypothetical protein
MTITAEYALFNAKEVLKDKWYHDEDEEIDVILERILHASSMGYMELPFYIQWDKTAEYLMGLGYNITVGVGTYDKISWGYDIVPAGVRE